MIELTWIQFCGCLFGAVWSGTFVGFFLAALCNAARKAEDEAGY